MDAVELPGNARRRHVSCPLLIPAARCRRLAGTAKVFHACRKDTKHQLGYLTPQEYGYLIAKRAVRFGENPERWLGNRQSVDAFRQG